MSTYEVTVTDRANGEVCFTTTITPAPWTARNSQKLAVDLARCIRPNHVVTVVGARDECQAET